MQSRYNSNLPGSIKHPSDIPIPHNFVISEGILQNREGKNITIPGLISISIQIFIYLSPFLIILSLVLIQSMI